MERVKNYLRSYSAKDYIKFAVILVSIAVLIAGIGYVYKTQVAPKLDPSYVANKEFTKGGEDDIALVEMFSVDWCPHCKKAKPVWKEVKDEYNGKVINGKTVKFVIIDCTKETADVQKLIKENDIKGYPTVKLKADGKSHDFDAKITRPALEQFLKSVLG